MVVCHSNARQQNEIKEKRCAWRDREKIPVDGFCCSGLVFLFVGISVQIESNSEFRCLSTNPVLLFEHYVFVEIPHQRKVKNENFQRPNQKLLLQKNLQRRSLNLIPTPTFTKHFLQGIFPISNVSKRKINMTPCLRSNIVAKKSAKL